MLRLSSEQLQVRDLAQDFADGELRPHAARWDEARALEPEVFGKLGELGFMGMLAPAAQGGLGLDMRTYLLVLEELARGDAAVALSVAIHCGPVTGIVLRHGTPAQQGHWLPLLASGKALGAFALSEPGAGSDAKALEARAEPVADGWILSGVKRWVTNGRRARVAVVFARTPAGVSAFLVDTHVPGYRVTRSERTLGLRASETVTVELDGVRVGTEALLGTEGAGLQCALEALDLGRVGIGAQALGIARAAMEHAVTYALERRQFGRFLADFGSTQAKLAEMHRRIAGARALVHQAGDALEEFRAGGVPRTGPSGVIALAAAAKLAASETATWVADEALQIFGGYGTMKDYPVEKLLRDAKGTEILEGTSEIMRYVIAREVLRAARAG